MACQLKVNKPSPFDILKELWIHLGKQQAVVFTTTVRLSCGSRATGNKQRGEDQSVNSSYHHAFKACLPITKASP